MPAKQGKLFLIGAGPGDPELLTLKAARVIAECDVILYDRLVGADILRLARPGAELIYVGKQAGEQQQTQEQIFALIVRHAREGKTVGRLKGGDPMVFGRGGEEMALAKSFGIPSELVPGVSAAIGVPGVAGVPLTYRQISNEFAVITAHQQEGQAGDWAKYVPLDTLVILMGVQNRQYIARSLIENGRPADDPVAFIENGTLPSQRVIESTLREVAAGNVNVRSPAVLVIGRVVRLR